VLQSASYDALFTAALDGAGIAVLPQFPVTNYLSAGALVHVLPEWMFGRFTVYAALPTRKLIPARTRAFLDFASEMSFTPIEIPPAPASA
jgi:DNA-binding transcriptional LysR family regulator